MYTPRHTIACTQRENGNSRTPPHNRCCIASPIVTHRGLSALGLYDFGLLEELASLGGLRSRVPIQLRRHRLAAFLQHYLEVVQSILLDAFTRHKCCGDTTSSGAASPADAVRVRLDVLGHVIVDDVFDALDVDAAARNVGCNKDLEFARLEALDRKLSRRLVFSRVDDGGRIAQLVEGARKNIAPSLAIAEDDDGWRRPVLQQLQELVFLLVLLEDMDVLHNVALGG
mmetsp:Transcript_947/g.2938  ORF Transcript_947/g.2938 Transcript_947/m.2938 type:complete len:228 (-) Transcript_947:1131-1814(-)